MSSLPRHLARTLSIGSVAGALAAGGGLALSASARAADAPIPGTPCTVTASETQNGVIDTGAVSCTGASQSATFTMCVQRDEGGTWVNVECVGDSGTAGGGGGFSTQIAGFQSATGYAYQVYTIASVAGQQGSGTSDSWETLG
jgi:hypothetical protein